MSNPKRHHVVPEAYLRGFSTLDNADRLWVYERGKREARIGNPKNEAVQSHYYTRMIEGKQDTSFESYLNDTFESPAAPVLQKLRRHEGINHAEKGILASYIAVMLKRVPSYKKRIHENAPNVLEQLRREEHEGLDTLLLSSPHLLDKATTYRNILDERVKELKQDIPQEFYIELINDRLSTVIQAMTWHYVTNPGGTGFITSDNPVFWFEMLGIGNVLSEITFPISTQLALLATWRNDIPEGFIEVTPSFEKQINRRIAIHADRYIYYAKHKPWVETLVNLDLKRAASKIRLVRWV